MATPCKPEQRQQEQEYAVPQPDSISRMLELRLCAKVLRPGANPSSLMQFAQTTSAVEDSDRLKRYLREYVLMNIH